MPEWIQNYVYSLLWVFITINFPRISVWVYSWTFLRILEYLVLHQLNILLYIRHENTQLKISEHSENLRIDIRIILNRILWIWRVKVCEINWPSIRTVKDIYDGFCKGGGAEMLFCIAVSLYKTFVCLSMSATCSGVFLCGNRRSMFENAGIGCKYVQFFTANSLFKSLNRIGQQLT